MRILDGFGLAEEFLLEDSSSSDDSDNETLLENHRRQMVVVILTVKELEDGKKKKRPGSKVDRLCIPRNRYFRNELLMQDYVAEEPTYRLTSSVEGTECAELVS